MSTLTTIRVFPDEITGNISPYLVGACIEDVNHEIYGGIYSQMIFGESFEEAPMLIDERLDPAFAGLTGTISCRTERTYLRDRSEVCSWQPFRHGTARGDFQATILRARRGRQSQRITFLDGKGEVGIENQGLNRWGLNFLSGKCYEGTLVVLAEADTALTISLESKDGERIYAEKILNVPGDHAWHSLNFFITPATGDSAGRFALKLKQPGSIWLDYVMLQPGPWGRFHNLPIRQDIGQGLVDEGLTVLRYGGYMINTDWEHELRCPGTGYRWKKSLDSRPDRPPYLGTFYPYNTNGFGIPDYAAYCKAAGFLCIPAICPSELAEDAADLVEYLNGSQDTTWGARRVANGYPDPLEVRYLQVGNEECTLDHKRRLVRLDYPELLGPILNAVAAKDPTITIIISPWLYSENELEWPENRKTVEKLLQVVHGHSVLWDVHVGGDNLRDADRIESFIPRLRKYINEIDPQNQVRFCILEENGWRHDLQRALGHAHNINVVERLSGEIVIDCAANCLQAYQQNDNFWDQGQLFYTPQMVWGMPPYYAQQMIARHYQPFSVKSSMEESLDLDITVARSANGKNIVIKVVNLGAEEQHTRILFEPESAGGCVSMQCLTGELDAINSPEEPEKVVPCQEEFPWNGSLYEHTFPPYSFSILDFKQK